MNVDVPKPKSDDQLHAFIKKHLCGTWPKKAKCPGHVTPFQVIADQFFGRTQDVVWQAPRSSGKTFSQAVLAVLWALFGMPDKKGDSLYAGAVSAQQEMFNRHLLEIVSNHNSNHDGLVYQHLLNLKKNQAKFLTGAQIDGTIMTYAGMGIAHPAHAFLDEIEMCAWIILKEFMVVSLGSTLIASTMKVRNGSLKQALVKAEEKGFQVQTTCARDVPNLYSQSRISRMKKVLDADDFAMQVMCE